MKSSYCFAIMLISMRTFIIDFQLKAFDLDAGFECDFGPGSR